nr:uncharacterized protein LOC125421471 [Ziziphus jujuba var. spinosa]
MDEYYDDDMLDILNDVYQSYEADDVENVEPNTSNEEIRNDNNGFDNLFVEAGRKLYPGDAFPEGVNIPKDTYSMKKMLRALGLGHEKIHACRNDCVLFWKENTDLGRCPIYDESRYKVKNIPHKVLRYFPLKPRLQRLYMSRHTSRDIRWHSEK